VPYAAVRPSDEGAHVGKMLEQQWPAFRRHHVERTSQLAAPTGVARTTSVQQPDEGALPLNRFEKIAQKFFAEL
jgi:hypothetical protein